MFQNNMPKVKSEQYDQVVMHGPIHMNKKEIELAGEVGQKPDIQGQVLAAHLDDQPEVNHPNLEDQAQAQEAGADRNADQPQVIQVFDA